MPEGHLTPVSKDVDEDVVVVEKDGVEVVKDCEDVTCPGIFIVP